MIAVDYIRAIAALAVAVFHLGGKSVPILNNGWLGVQMFFVLSGFIICWSFPQQYQLNNFLTFIAKRFTRINPPYLLSIILLVAINAIFQSPQADLKNIIAHFFYINKLFNFPDLNPVYWTLAIEFQFYILIGLCFPLLRQRWGKWLLLLSNLILFAYPINGSSFATFLPLFSFGVLAFYILSDRIKPWSSLLLLGSLSVISLSSLGFLQTLSGIFAFGLILTDLPDNKIISFVSKISFSLYLTHDIIGSRIVVYFGSLVERTMLVKGTLFLTGIAISIISAWLFYELAEKPFTKLAKQIRYKPMMQPLLKK